MTPAACASSPGRCAARPTVQRHLSASSASSSIRASVTADVLDCYAAFEFHTRTKLRLDETSGAPNWAPNAPRADGSAHPPPPSRSVLFRCVWHLWDVSLVKPLQVLAATCGVTIGIVVVVLEASWSVFRQLGSTLYGTFLSAFEYVHGAQQDRSLRARAKKNVDGRAAATLPATPETLPSPELGGRTPSLASVSEASVWLPASPAFSHPSLAEDEGTSLSPRVSSPRPTLSPGTEMPFDGVLQPLPNAQQVALPVATCAICSMVVAPNEASIHLAGHGEDAR